MGIQPPHTPDPPLPHILHDTAIALLLPDIDDDDRYAPWERAHVAVRECTKRAHQLASTAGHHGGLATSDPGRRQNGDILPPAVGGCTPAQRKELRQRILAWRESTYVRVAYYSSRAAIISDQCVEAVVAPDMVDAYMAEGEGDQAVVAGGVLGSGTEMMRALERSGMVLGPLEVTSVDTWDALVVLVRRWRDGCLGRGKKRQRAEQDASAESTPRSKQRFWASGA